MSMSNATAVAIYLEAKKLQAVFKQIADMLNTTYLRIMQQRWVEDLFLIIVTDCPFPEHGHSNVHHITETMYKPFNLKIEDASVFVGFSLVIFDARTASYIRSDIAIPRGIHFCNKGRTRAEIVSGSARLPHGLANL